MTLTRNFHSYNHYKFISKSIMFAFTLLITSLVPTSLAIDFNSIKNADKSKDIKLSQQQVNSLKSKKLTAALVWHGSSAWVSAVNKGAKETFSRFGIDVVAVTDAQFDPAKQVADLENVSVLNPDIILSLCVDSTSTKQSYRSAIGNGAKLVLLSNPIEGFIHHQDYVGIVTDDMFGMGEAAAQLTIDSLNNSGKLGVIYHDAKYFITNNRDHAFRQALKSTPNIDIVIEKGFVKENETSNIAAAMVLQHPEIEAIYVSWDSAAEGVIEALRSLNRPDIKVITHDLGVNNLLDMATNRNLYGTVADRPYDIGATMAKLGASAILGQRAAQVTIVPFDKVTKTNITSAWLEAFKEPVPKLLMQALQQ